MERRPSPRKPPVMEDSSSSSDEGEIIGSPKKSLSRASIKKPTNQNVDTVLSGSVRTASYNIVFQVMTRIFTFLLNAFILRYVTHDVLGICNVRLALLYSTIMFLSREPFRRVCQRRTESDSWRETVNLIWLVVPSTVLWSFFLGYIWCYLLSQPGPADSPLTLQYQKSVWIVCFGLILDSLSEAPYIIGQYFLFSKLRIVGDTALIAIRSSLLCLAVVYSPDNAVLAYSWGNLISAIIVSLIYYAFFYWYIHVKKGQVPAPKSKNHPNPNESEPSGVMTIPFNSIQEFFPDMKSFKVPQDMTQLTWSFFKQGILKQLLTEGERYLMTFFDVLSFKEQGLYDLVSNLGSLAARFIFLPIEESSYYYFSHTLHRRAKFTPWDRESSRHCAYVLGNLVRLMMLIGSIAIVYGLPYSKSLLFLYGGENLAESSNGIATKLLQANCVYILVMAVNGITETFTFAAMTQDQLDQYNKKLVIFSAVFLLGSMVFVYLFGSVGFFIANGLNMILRIRHSVYLIRDVFDRCDFDPFQSWKPNRLILAFFASAFLVINLLYWVLEYGLVAHVAVGLVIFTGNCYAIYANEKELLYFFVQMFKSSKTNTK